MKIAQARLVWSLALLVLASGACGGSEAPAQTGGAAPPVAPPSADAPAAAPTPSAESAAGVRAFDAGNYAEARKSFEAAAKKNPGDYDSLQNLGLACEKLGDTPAAESAYKAALAVKPDLETATTALSALYVDAGRNDEAAAVARAGLARHPASAVLHENLAVSLAAKGDGDGATKEFLQAIQLTPADPMFHLTFAHWLNVWKVHGAAVHLDAARDLAKEDYGLIVSIGFEYRMAGEYDSCVKILDHAITIKDGGEVRTHRALCRLGLKDEKGTLADLQGAVEKEPTYAPAHYYLAGRLATSKRYRDAAAEYAKYLELAPSGSLAKAAAERMKAAQDAAGKKK